MSLSEVEHNYDVVGSLSEVTYNYNVVNSLYQR